MRSARSSSASRRGSPSARAHRWCRTSASATSPSAGTARRSCRSSTSLLLGSLPGVSAALNLGGISNMTVVEGGTARSRLRHRPGQRAARRRRGRRSRVPRRLRRRRHDCRQRERWTRRCSPCSSTSRTTPCRHRRAPARSYSTLRTSSAAIERSGRRPATPRPARHADRADRAHGGPRRAGRRLRPRRRLWRRLPQPVTARTALRAALPGVDDHDHRRARRARRHQGGDRVRAHRLVHDARRCPATSRGHGRRRPAGARHDHARSRSAGAPDLRSTPLPPLTACSSPDERSCCGARRRRRPRRDRRSVPRVLARDATRQCCRGGRGGDDERAGGGVVAARDGAVGARAARRRRGRRARRPRRGPEVAHRRGPERRLGRLAVRGPGPRATAWAAGCSTTR